MKCASRIRQENHGLMLEQRSKALLTSPWLSFGSVADSCQASSIMLSKSPFIPNLPIASMFSFFIFRSTLDLEYHPIAIPSSAPPI